MLPQFITKLLNKFKKTPQLNPNEIIYLNGPFKVLEILGADESNAIQFVLDSQTLFQKRMGHNFETMSPKEKAAYIREMILWAEDELHEALHELPFAKDWSLKYNKPDYDYNQHLLLFKEEMIDALHFFFNIMACVGMTEEEILRMYKEKHQINYDRQENGY